MVLGINTSCSKNKSEDSHITVKKDTVFFVNDTTNNLCRIIITRMFFFQTF